MMIKTCTIIALFVQITLQQQGCQFSLFDTATWNPVIVSTNYEVLYPSLENDPNDRNITLPVGGTIIISCNGGRFQNEDLQSIKTVFATCNQDFQFEILDKIVDLKTIYCSNYDHRIVTKLTDVLCGPGAHIIEEGFQIGLNIKLVTQIKNCFDFKNNIPLYTNYNLTKSIGFIKSYLTETYIEDSYYNITVDWDTIYNNFTRQQEIFNPLFGLLKNSTRYIDPLSCQPSIGLTTPGFCFVGLTITYRGNFVYLSQQETTFRYINMVPQWSFISYNIEKLERNIIDYAKINRVDLDVYIGTYGVATIPHAQTGEEIELYMYMSETTKSLPVPLLFWKLVYDPLTFRATVFVIINDPHHTDVTNNVICNDISDNISWLTWEKHNITKGYSYACTYEEAKATITYIPEIYVENVLI